MKKIKLLTLIFFTTCIASQSFSQNDSCLEFDGFNDYVLIGDVNDLGTSDFTIEAWVYIQNSAGVGHKVVNKGLSMVGTPYNAGYGLRTNDNQLTSDIDFQIVHSDGSAKYVEYTGITTNVWYHIAGVRSGKYLYLYLDGALVDSDSTSVVYDVDTDLPLAIGAIHKGGFSSINEFMDGKIDEVRIWNIARTACEINTYKDACLQGNEAGLIGYWRFEEGSGTLVADLTSNGNDGTLENGVLWSDSVPFACADFCTVTITVYDTVTVYDTITYYDTVLVSVTDTLIIDITLTGVNPPNNMNTLLVYPNPANDQITIDYGNYLSMAGYTLKIINNLGQDVFSSLITTPKFVIDISALGSSGLYFIQVLDAGNNVLVNRKLLLE